MQSQTESQVQAGARTEQHVLYQYASCPFCQRVLRYLAEAGIEIELRDVLRDAEARRELLEGGGSTQVPCLRIDTTQGDRRWLYESLDIIAYLRGYYQSG
ncbi:MAG: glutathione S-transferase N-terminal domain-containing protein [Pseudomonadales bacterium]